MGLCFGCGLDNTIIFQKWDRRFGLPGTVVAPNITPDSETGIGNWTDGEKIRAIYAFLRTFKPVHNPVKTHPDAPKLAAK
jgi:hypothetical protein